MHRSVSRIPSLTIAFPGASSFDWSQYLLCTLEHFVNAINHRPLELQAFAIYHETILHLTFNLIVNRDHLAYSVEIVLFLDELVSRVLEARDQLLTGCL